MSSNLVSNSSTVGERLSKSRLRHCVPDQNGFTHTEEHVMIILKLDLETGRPHLDERAHE